MKISEIVRGLEERCPPGTAEDWDNVGLLAGDPDWRTRGAVVSIDLTPRAIETARRKGFRLILNHHPCIFPKSRGLGRVTAGGAGTSGLVFEAIRQGIAVASFHTNFDRCALEVVEAVSSGLGCVPRGRLIDDPDESLLKLSVFVPESHAEAVRQALFAAGAGQIGRYDSCSFSSVGEGTFRGQAGTEPFLGQPGRLERVRELQIETVFPKGLERPVLSALRRAHPYEEIAYDLYALRQAPEGRGLVRGLGYGFWGEFAEPKTFSELARDVKTLFHLNGFVVTEPRPKKVRTIGFVAGKGASFLGAAARAGCDLLITGEAGYHVALDGTRRGVAVMELGHRESEFFFLKTMSTWIRQEGLSTVALNTPTQKISASGDDE